MPLMIACPQADASKIWNGSLAKVHEWMEELNIHSPAPTPDQGCLYLIKNCVAPLGRCGR